MKLPRARSVLVAALVLFGAGAGWAILVAGLPFQDATPDMETRWRFHHRVADLMMIAGAILLALGLLLALARRFGARRISRS